MGSRRRSRWTILFFAVFWLVLYVAASLLGALVEPQTAVAALETHGFSDVQIQEHVYFFTSVRGCDRGDAALFRARARNPAGKVVDVIVCVGWPFKGATVRVP